MLLQVLKGRRMPADPLSPVLVQSSTVIDKDESADGKAAVKLVAKSANQPPATQLPGPMNPAVAAAAAPVTGSISIAQAPRAVRRGSDETEGEGYSSSPSSTSSALLLKPLTPAQSGEHRLHEIKETVEEEPGKSPMTQLLEIPAGTLIVEEHANGTITLPLR